MPFVSCVARVAESERGIVIIVSGMLWATFCARTSIFLMLQA